MEKSRIERTLIIDFQKLREEIFVQEQFVPIELEIEENENKYIHCSIYEDELLIAYARVCLDNPAIIGRVCVKKEFRNKGYGRKIMSLAEAQIQGTNEVQIHAQTHAKGFYEALGYTAFGNLFFEAGIEHVSMKKYLRPYDINTLA